MMKKVFSIILLTFFLFLGSNAVSINDANAQDVWAYSKNDCDYYIYTPVKHLEAENGFMCNVTVVHNGNFHSTFHVKFAYAKNLVINYYVMDKRDLSWKLVGNIKNDPCIEAIYEVGSNY